MLAFGYAGETGLLEAWVGFFFGMAGWGYTVFFMLQAQTVSNHCKTSLRSEDHAQGLSGYRRLFVGVQASQGTSCPTVTRLGATQGP